jgi:LCP family protein required for cell wall assembly
MSRRLTLPVLALALGAFAIAVGIGAFVVRPMVAQHESTGDLVAEIVRKAATLTLPTPQSLFGKDRVLVLLLGIDYDYDQKDMPYSSSSRSDTIMVASLDLNAKQIRLVSVPRDMEATFDGHTQKINAAYADGGIKEAEQVIGSWLGLPQIAPGRYFDRYMVLRIAATKDLINAIGGVDVVPDETMNYDDNWGHLHIHFVGGKLYHMNGDQAVSYMRFRHDACSDPCRIKRQQQVIRLVLAKLENDKLNDIAHLRDLIDATRRDVITNFNPEELLSLANAYADFNIADLHATQIPFTGDRVTAYAGDMLVPDDAQRTKIVASLFAPPSDTPNIDPAKIRVRVENGTDVPGLAGTLAAALQKEGFVIAGVTNADKSSYAKTVIRLAATAPAGTEQMLKSDLKLANVKILADRASAVDRDVTIIVGKDYAKE